MINDWNELEAPVKVAAKIDAPVRLGIRKPKARTKPGQTGRGRVRLLLRADVAKALGIGGLTAENLPRVSIRLGKGERAHQMSLVVKSDGKFELLKIKNPWAAKRQGGVVASTSIGYKINIGIIESWPDVDLPIMELKHTIEDEAGKKVLVMDLPMLLWKSNPLRDAGLRTAK